jgi:hypothetical protein
LHDPEAVEIIRETMRLMPDVPHFASFDTVFHQTMPEEAFMYAIPAKYREQGVKRLWIPWVELRVSGEADAKFGSAAATNGDCPPREWVQRDGSGGG